MWCITSSGTNHPRIPMPDNCQGNALRMRWTSLVEKALRDKGERKCCSYTEENRTHEPLARGVYRMFAPSGSIAIPPCTVRLRCFPPTFRLPGGFSGKRSSNRKRSILHERTRLFFRFRRSMAMGWRIGSPLDLAPQNCRACAMSRVVTNWPPNRAAPQRPPCFGPVSWKSCPPATF